MPDIYGRENFAETLLQGFGALSNTIADVRRRRQEQINYAQKLGLEQEQFGQRMGLEQQQLAQTQAHQQALEKQAQQQLEIQRQGLVPEDIRKFRFAQSQGFKGSLQEFLQTAEGGDLSLTPAPYRDASGKLGWGQFSKSGGFHPVPPPEGAEFLSVEEKAQAAATGRETGKAAVEREFFKPQATLALQNSVNGLDRLSSEAAGLSANKALWKATGWAGLALPYVPGSEAAAISAKIRTLKSQIGFGVLQAMRDASKTGGALGNISNFEIAELQNNLAALETITDPEDFATALDQVVAYAAGAKQRLTDAYASTYPDGGGPPSPPGGGGPTATDANGNKVQWNGSTWVPIGQ